VSGRTVPVRYSPNASRPDMRKIMMFDQFDDEFDTIYGDGNVRHLAPNRAGSCIGVGTSQTRPAGTHLFDRFMRPCHICSASIREQKSPRSYCQICMNVHTKDEECY
jgi:hypothetical protein